MLIKLSDKYDISVIEIIKAKDKKIYKNYTVNMKEKDSENKEQYHFNNKRQLVSWLTCLE